MNTYCIFLESLGVYFFYCPSLFHLLHKPHRHIHPGTSQQLQPHHHLSLPIHFHQFAFHSCQRPFHHLHPFSGFKWGSTYFHRLLTIIQHKLEPFHLLIRNNGRSMLPAQHHVSAYGRQCQHL